MTTTKKALKKLGAFFSIFDGISGRITSNQAKKPQIQRFPKSKTAQPPALASISTSSTTKVKLPATKPRTLHHRSQRPKAAYCVPKTKDPPSPAVPNKNLAKYLM